MTVAIVIPARWSSTRLPEKMMLSLTGKPLIQHTYERAIQAKKATRVLIATDDERIAAAAQGFGAEVVMTGGHHPTGTDRLGEVVAHHLPNAELVINVQGDEPEIDPLSIDKLITLFESSDAQMGTLVTPFQMSEGQGSPLDPNCPKALLGAPVKHAQGHVLGYQALYFSRSLVPYPRDQQGVVVDPQAYYHHLGIYSYKPDFLKHFLTLPQGQLEKIEKLEQLRVLEHGYKIVAGVVEQARPSIDTLADYQQFVRRYLEGTHAVCTAS